MTVLSRMAMRDGIDGKSWFIFSGCCCSATTKQWKVRFWETTIMRDSPFLQISSVINHWSHTFLSMQDNDSGSVIQNNKINDCYTQRIWLPVTHRSLDIWSEKATYLPYLGRLIGVRRRTELGACGKPQTPVDVQYVVWCHMGSLILITQSDIFPSNLFANCLNLWVFVNDIISNPLYINADWNMFYQCRIIPPKFKLYIANCTFILVHFYSWLLLSMPRLSVQLRDWTKKRKKSCHAGLQARW